MYDERQAKKVTFSVHVNTNKSLCARAYGLVVFHPMFKVDALIENHCIYFVDSVNFFSTFKCIRF